MQIHPGLLLVPVLAGLMAFSAQGAMLVQIAGDFGTTTATGPEGGAAGWGGTIQFVPDYVGQPTQYALFTGVDFDTTTPIGVFTPFFASTQFVMLVQGTPADTWTESYDSSIPTGIGQIDFFTGLPPGSASIGTLIFYYDLYSADPFTSTDPDILIGTGYSVSATALARIGGTVSPDPVPEPGSAALVALGLSSGLAVAFRRRQRTN